ncbi:hypothetical protein BRC66_00870 [Halobacteriales archaeon QH_2_66_30]|jgi:Mg2+/Co2+ transporter CorB|nr:MAG: hypothetical protein BRC66_00870 [Halobacteriales archaeon QH_2_66_30]
MYERLGLEEGDLRNMGVVVGIMTLVMVVTIDAPLVPRLVAALVLGVISAAAFLIVTILIRVFTVY